ncbi:MAG TPA: GNAT family N-acetyltransferase [Fimbriimonas sp.]|nr:GNAT family N-acetyltransferase [Fimbriimonas sp.]
MPFELQPTLTAEFLELQPLREDDFEALFAVASDPLIWEQHPNSDRYREDVFREFFRGAMESGGAFKVVDRKTGQVIGSTRYANYREAESEIEIGWTFLARKYWGGRYNWEMKGLMLNHAFRFVETVVFHVGPTNWRSRKAMEKIGGVLNPNRPDSAARSSVTYEIKRP